MLSPDGRLDSTNAASFQADVLGAIDTNEKIVLDFSTLSYVSSAGLRSVLVAAKAAESRQIGFAICALLPNVQEIFTVTGFDKIISVHDDLAAALSTENRIRS